MDELGPAWLRNELPHPIASAWNLTLNANAIDAMAAAATVEVALRLVTGLQFASLMAGDDPLPERLRTGRFGRPTLGDWRHLTCELRDALHAPFLPALAAWPDPHTDGLLRQLGNLRNGLGHEPVGPLARLEDARAIGDLAATILESLAWLRQVELFQVVEARPEGDDRFSGRIQVFRSLTPHPPAVRAAWRGVLPLNHLYLAADGAVADTVLDVEPFLRVARLDNAPAEALCLWKGYGKRGDVLLHADLLRASAWVPFEPAARLMPHARLATRRTATDATLPDAPADDPPTTVAPTPTEVRAGTSPAFAATPEALRTPRRRRWPLWLSAGFILAVVGSVGAVTLTASEPSPARLAAPAPCALPNLAGAWRFDTRPLSGKPGAERGLAVTGHYTLAVGGRAATCALSAELVKTGYTYPDRDTRRMEENRDRLEAPLLLAASPSGRTVAARARLHVPETGCCGPEPGDAGGGRRSRPPPAVEGAGPQPIRSVSWPEGAACAEGRRRCRNGPGAARTVADIALRFVRQGDLLVGLWRHEGADGDAAGYSGGLIGRLDAAVDAPMPQLGCVLDCLNACHDGHDPLDPGTEPCLRDCARKVTDCPLGPALAAAPAPPGPPASDLDAGALDPAALPAEDQAAAPSAAATASDTAALAAQVTTVMEQERALVAVPPSAPAAGPASPPGPCTKAALAGRWRFSTEVLHARPERQTAVGVMGHYVASLVSATARCAVSGVIAKTGYTEAGRHNSVAFRSELTLDRSTSGRSFAGRALLAPKSGAGSATAMAWRIAAHDGALIGLWRYEGDAWAKTGYSGGLVGAAEADAQPSAGRACFHACVTGCYDGADPLTEATEACLLGCAPELDRCAALPSARASSSD